MDEKENDATRESSSDSNKPNDLPPAVKIAPGEIVAGRYRVIEELGRGGMAVVYRVEHIFLREVHALKVLGAGLSDISSVRFQKEAQVCRLLDHPNLIRVLDFAVLEDHSPFLVMEFLQGQTLAQLLNSQGSLAEKPVLDIFIQVLDGLEYAHKQGVVHRDLKPSNIMLYSDATGRVEVKIVDFGIARMVAIDSLNSMSLTRTGEIFGSPLYMSPEQCRGSVVDLRSDLYSVGCAMYQALTGAPPFTGETALSTMMLHQNQPPALLQEASLGNSYSAAIERVILKLLAKSPDERYQSAAEVRTDLLAIRNNNSLKVPLNETVVKKEKGPLPYMALFLSLICSLLVTAQAYFLFSRKQLKAAVPTAVYTPPPSVQSPLPGQPYFASVPISKSTSGPWKLDFPKTSVGKIDLSALSSDSNSKHEDPQRQAQGTVIFPKAAPLIFMTDMRDKFKAEDFLRFRPDEIAELQLVDEFVDDAALANISSYKAIKNLELIFCRSLSDECATSIVKLSSLKTLRVEGQSISSAQIGRITKAMKLPSVLTSKVSKPHDLVRELLSARGLTCLFIENNPELTDADLADIGKLKGLKVLALSGCKNITDAGISKLTKLPNLNCISLLGTNITAKSISTFKKFPHHCWLRVDYGKWSYDDRVLFVKEFTTHCDVP